MFPIILKLNEDISKMTKRNVREFKKEFKVSLKMALQLWIDRFLPLHFERVAYSRYPGVHNFIKKGDRKPLVFTGHLRDTILQGEKEISTPGTGGSIRGKIRMKFGRPSEYDFSKIDTVAEKIRLESNITLAEARKRAFKIKFSRGGYDPATKLRFQNEITALNQAEINVMSKLIEKRMLAQLKKQGPRRRRTFKG